MTLAERTLIFLEKSKLSHNDKYDYSLANYINANTKIEIICPIHGSFRQSPFLHMNGAGCKQCVNELLKIQRISNIDVFVEKANVVHNNFYDYSNGVYDGALTNIIITCPIHGEFEQLPSNHLRGHGCVECRNDKHSLERRDTVDEFITKAKQIYGDRFNYDKVVYINNSTPIIITCKEHGDFIQRPFNHFEGVGCKECSKKERPLGIGFSKAAWIRFCKNKNLHSLFCYIVRLYNDTESFIKIGITADLKDRFRKFPYSVEKFHIIENTPEYIWDKEKELHRCFKKEKYKPLISFDGQTECFTLNIFK